MEECAQPASGHAGSSKLDDRLHFLFKRPGDYNRGLVGSVHPALRPWHGDREMLNMIKAEIELSWQGAMLRTGEKPCERQKVAPLYLYWRRSGYSGVTVLCKSIPVPGWEGK